MSHNLLDWLSTALWRKRLTNRLAVRRITPSNTLFNYMRTFHRNFIFLIAISLVIALVLIWQLDIIEPAAVAEISAHPSKEVNGQGLTSNGSEEPRSTNEPTSSIAATMVKPEPSTSTRKIIEPTNTVLPIYTASPLPTVIQSPISSPRPKPTDVIQPTVLEDGIDRTCPDPAPGKPDYQHYYLSGQPWPKPVDNPQEHFWLTKPLPGGGRMLYTDWLPYGYDAGGRYLLHNGVDVADPMGTALLAAADGQVIVAGPDTNLLYGWRCDWYGSLVVIELDQQWEDRPVFILYGHVLNISVEVGQHVNLGEQLAEVGIGGAAGNPHLHFEVRLGTNEFKSTSNPFLWLQPPDTRGIIVGRLIDPQGRPWQGVAITAVGRSEGAENRTSWTYLGDSQQLIKPDEKFAENFVIPDLRPGMYELYVELQDQIYQVPVEVQGGQMVRAEIITDPYKTPTPESPNQPSASAPASAPASPPETSTPQG